MEVVMRTDDTEYSNEAKNARTLINILGRNNPHIETVEAVQRILFYKDNAKEILDETLKALFFRFEISIERAAEALNFIDKILIKPKPRLSAKTQAQIKAEENKALIKNMYSSGMTRNQISNYLNIPFSTIRDLIIANKFKKQKEIKTFNAFIRYMLNTGKTSAEISKEIEIDEQVVSIHIKMNFVKKDDRYDCIERIPQSEILKLRMAELINLRNKGYNSQQISEIFAISKSSVIQFINKNQEVFK